MDLEQGLTVELTAISGLANKVYPIVAKQDAQVPYLTYALESNDRIQTLTGHDNLVQSQYQVDLYHSTYAGLKALKKLVVQNIKTYNLRNIGSTGPFVQQVEIVTDFETYEDSIKLYKGVLEFNIYYKED